jgi:hypothetical protein
MLLRDLPVHLDNNLLEQQTTRLTERHRYGLLLAYDREEMSESCGEFMYQLVGSRKVLGDLTLTLGPRHLS